MATLARFAKTRDKYEVGATIVKYGIITLALIAAVRAIGIGLKTLFTDLATGILKF